MVDRTAAGGVNASTHCTQCRSELSIDEKRGCKICLTCHPPQTVVQKKEEKDRKHYLDIKLTPEQRNRIVVVIKEIVPAMILDVLENWHIQKPPVILDANVINEAIESHTREVANKSWREQAKSLGIEVYDKENKRPRKKDDVIKEIAEKQKGKQDGESKKENT